MKKWMLILSLMLIGQEALLAMVDTTRTPVWKITAAAGGQGFLGVDDLTRSIALNRATGHLLVATRRGGPRIVVLNAATGDSLGQLNMSGVSGGLWPLSKVAVAADGVIYACNLTANNSLKIYRWAHEAAAPTVAADAAVSGARRYGDAFSVSGAGAQTAIYISGNDPASRLAVLGSADGVQYTVQRVLPQNGQCTDMAVLDANTIWVKRPGVAALRLDGQGVVTGSVPLAVMPASGTALTCFGYAGYWYLAGGDGAGQPAAGRLVQLADELSDSRLQVIYSGLGDHLNAEGGGAVVVDPEGDRLWLLSTNNGLALYPFGGYALFPLAWRLNADAESWQGRESQVRSMAYSRKTEHLYLATRSGVPHIRVIEAGTGAFVRELDRTGMPAGELIESVTATADGQIFAAAVAAADSPQRLYHYWHEEATPTVVWEGLLPGRTGDALACSGTGSAVQLFLSGLGQERIYTFAQAAGTQFERGGEIPLPAAGAAARTIAPVNGGSYLFTAAPGQPLRYLRRDGTLLYEFGAEVAAAAVHYAEIPALDGSTRKFIFINSGGLPGVRVIELIGEEGDNLALNWEYWDQPPAATPTYGRQGSSEGLGRAVYDLYNNRLIELAVNDGVSAYSFASIMPNAGLYAPDPRFTPQVLDFGRVQLDDFATLPLLLINRGTAPLEITDASGESGFFSSDLALPAAVAPGDTLRLHITFTALNAGDIEDVWTLATNAGLLEIPLYGEAFELWPLQWRLAADTTSWLGSSGEVRTLVCNQTTGHLLTASSAGGAAILALDGQNGRVVRQLNSGGIGGGTRSLNMLAVTADGQIFAGNLAAAGENFKLYHYADEEARPVLIFDGLLEGRVGDALDLEGEGEKVTLFVSGLQNSQIHVIQSSDGISWKRGESLLLPEKGAAAYAISPAGADHLFIQGPGMPVRYLDRGGRVKHTFAPPLFGGTTCRYFEVVRENGEVRRFIASCGSAPGTRVVELLGTPGEGLCSQTSILPAATPVWSAAVNAEATAQIAWDRMNHSLLELVSNNGLSAYSFFQVEPSPMTWTLITPIVTVKADGDNDYKPDRLGQIHTIQGVVTTLNYNTGNSSSYWLQDERGRGINFYSGKINFRLQPGDLVQITGKVEFYNGLTEITTVDSAAVKVLGTRPLPAPLEIDGPADLNERSESSLVRLSGYYLATPERWPAAGQNSSSANPLLFVRGVDTVIVFIDKETDIDGSPAPSGWYAITGVVDQYTRKTPPDDLYEIRPRSLADFSLMTAAGRVEETLPAEYHLAQNYPNPFNPVTTIKLALPQSGHVTIRLFDLLGREAATIFNGRLDAGYHTFTFDGQALASGIYLYRVEAGEWSAMRKMTLVK